MKLKATILLVCFILGHVNAMMFEPGVRERLLEEAEPDEDIFIAEINTDDGNCGTIQTQIETLCLAQDPQTNMTENQLSDFGDGECFLKFRCLKDYADSDALVDLIDDVVDIEHDSAVLAEGLPTLNKELWNLDRIDSVNLNFDKSFDPKYTGNGINIYIVDTGVHGTHEQFAGRVLPGATVFPNEPESTDGNGHGTHCAGTALGKDTGVAINANLIPIKVLSNGGSGSTSGVIRGLERAVQIQKNTYGNAPAVISMSLGGAANKEMDNAARAAAKAGHIVVVAAGNYNSNACKFSPAGAGGNGKKMGVITVGSTDKRDYRSSFSNFGRCVDIFAPGTTIASSWTGGNSQYKTISGTSMATPLVAGVAATMLEKHGNKADAQAELLAIVSINKIDNVGTGSPNELVHAIKTTAVGSPTPQPTRPPLPKPPVLAVGGLKMPETGDNGRPNWFRAKFAPSVSSLNTVTGPLAITDDICGPWNKNEFKDMIVMVERGDCLFYSKGIGLENAGAKAVILTQDSNAVPFEMGYYGSGKDMSIPMAMISKSNAIKLEKFITKTVVWGLDPDEVPSPLLPVDGTPTPPPTIPTEIKETPLFDKYFKDNDLTGQMCEIANRTQFIKKKQRARDIESCAKSCLKRKTCVAMNFRDVENVGWKCSLLKKCDAITSVDDFVGYRYVKPNVTFAPTPSGITSFERYFKGNDTPGKKCKQTTTNLISKSVLVTKDQCAQLCAQNAECTYMNYNDIDGKCDLVKKCRKVASKKIVAFKKIDSMEGNTGGGGGGNPTGTGIIFETYFGRNSNKLSNGTLACRQVYESEVLEFEMDLTKEDCAKRCVGNTLCTHMNYNSNKRGPCTLLKKCTLVEGATKTESFISNDVADELTIEEVDEGEEGTTDDDGPLADMTLWELFGIIILSIFIFGVVVFVGYKVYPSIKSFC